MGCPVAVIFYLFILWVIKLFDADLTPFCCLVFSYQHIGTSVSSIIGCFGNVAYSSFTSSSMYFTNFSLQSLSRYIFNRSRTSPWAKVQCTHHADGKCMFIFPYMVPWFFSRPSLYSSCLYTAHRLVLKYFQILHTA